MWSIRLAPATSSTPLVEPSGEAFNSISLEPETVMWANGSLAQNPDLLRPGQELIILPIDGVYHTVVKGDTLVGHVDGLTDLTLKIV